MLLKLSKIPISTLISKWRELPRVLVVPRSLAVAKNKKLNTKVVPAFPQRTNQHLRYWSTLHRVFWTQGRGEGQIVCTQSAKRNNFWTSAPKHQVKTENGFLLATAIQKGTREQLVVWDLWNFRINLACSPLVSVRVLLRAFSWLTVMPQLGRAMAHNGLRKRSPAPHIRKEIR